MFSQEQDNTNVKMLRSVQSELMCCKRYKTKTIQQQQQQKKITHKKQQAKTL